jgi:hypothetical protein
MINVLRRIVWLILFLPRFPLMVAVMFLSLLSMLIGWLFTGSDDGDDWISDLLEKYWWVLNWPCPE